MSNNKNHWNQIFQSEPNALSRIGNTLKITGKILKENNQSLVFSEIKSVKIGDQIWTTENLNVDRFRNGEIIPEARTNEEWEKACQEGKPGWCYYDNDPANGLVYGKLYNWFAVNDPRGIAPEGWHIPSHDEWLILSEFLGEMEAGDKIKSNTGWMPSSVISTITNGNGTNESNFLGLPGGVRQIYKGMLFFNDKGEVAEWWTSSENGRDTNSALIRTATTEWRILRRSSREKGSGCSIRCICY
jgi:uncharacterized protein (TIGR02145 family)